MFIFFIKHLITKDHTGAIMRSHDFSGAVEKAHEGSVVLMRTNWGALMSTHKYGAMVRWVLMSAQSTILTYFWVFMSAYEFSPVLIAAHVSSGGIMSAIEGSWALKKYCDQPKVAMITHEPWIYKHSWALMALKNHTDNCSWVLLSAQLLLRSTKVKLGCKFGVEFDNIQHHNLLHDSVVFYLSNPSMRKVDNGGDKYHPSGTRSLTVCNVATHAKSKMPAMLQCL